VNISEKPDSRSGKCPERVVLFPTSYLHHIANNHIASPNKAIALLYKLTAMWRMLSKTQRLLRNEM